MGIPAFFSYIIKHHPNILIKHKNMKLHKSDYKKTNLFIDANSIIYDSLRNINSEDSNLEQLLYKEVCNKIDSLIRLLKPNHEVIIAFDGVAPLAKLEQQRTRRYKSAFMHSHEDKKDISWNTSNITPGTQFMKQLMAYIEDYYSHHSFSIERLQIFTSNTEGEGEHKIFEYIRQNKDRFIRYLYNEMNTIIYGLDADLIMLCLVHQPYFQHFYLYRETPEFIKSLHSSLNEEEQYLIDIHSLKVQILRTLKKYYGNGKKMLLYNGHEKIIDYIFICFLFGNDFLPHFPSLNIRTFGFDNILYAYCQSISMSKTIITKQHKINWKLFRTFCNKLYENELQNIKVEVKQRKTLQKKYNNNLKRYKSIENIPILKQNIEDAIDIHRKGWQERYYIFLFDMEYNEENIQKICLNYLEGLEWTLTYYTDTCKNWQWKYNYHYPPLFEDLIKYIPYFDTTLLTENYDKVSPITQLCYVLPKSSFGLIPEETKTKLLDALGYKYPDEYEFNWAFCKYFWESHISLPEISIKEIEMAIAV